MNELADKQEEYDRLMTRYLAEIEHEERLIEDRIRCREVLGELQWRITEAVYQIRDLRESNAV